MKPVENWQIDRVYSSRFSPEILFEAWVSPEMVVPPVVKMEVKPKVGGYLILHAQTEADTFVMKGVFIAFERDKELTYSWNWEGSEEMSTVNVKFDKQKIGTIIQLKHIGFLTEDSMTRHAKGWDDYTSKLEIALEKKGN